jgi:hypothetical protein
VCSEAYRENGESLFVPAHLDSFLSFDVMQDETRGWENKNWTINNPVVIYT